MSIQTLGYQQMFDDQNTQGNPDAAPLCLNDFALSGKMSWQPQSVFCVKMLPP